MNGSECRNLNELAAESRGNGNLAHGKGFEQEAEASRFHKECLDRSQVRDRQQPSWSSCSWQNATIYSGLQAEARTLSHCWVLPRQTDTLSGAVLWKTDILPCRSQNLVSQGRSPFCASVLSPLNVPGTVYQALSSPHHFTQCTHYCTHPQLPVQHPSNHHSQTTHPPAGRSPHHQTIYIGSKI